MSNLDRKMHRSLWVLVAHSSFIEGSLTTKNTASGACPNVWNTRFPYSETLDSDETFKTVNSASNKFYRMGLCFPLHSLVHNLFLAPRHLARRRQHKDIQHNNIRPGNPDCRGRLSTDDLLIKITGFVKKKEITFQY